jgi:hypothetical protein
MRRQFDIYTKATLSHFALSCAFTGLYYPRKCCDIRVSAIRSVVSNPDAPTGVEKEELVTHALHFAARALLVVGIGLLLGAAVTSVSSAQEKRIPQTAGVDNTKMGPYRALAQLALAASQKGDNATAAQLARVLERTWDKAEDYGGDTALSKTNHALFEQIDKAMDTFITLLVDHPASAPDAAKVKAAYNAFMEKLKLAD